MLLDNKKCPGCRSNMIKTKGTDIGVMDDSLADEWKCTNPNCGHKETKSYFDKMCEEHYIKNK